MTPVSHYIQAAGEQTGPFTLSQLQSMWQSGSLTRETLHWMDGYTEWMPLEYILEDLEPRKLPPSYHATQRANQPIVVAKSRGIYIILGLLILGFFGFHNFYAGRFIPAVCQLLITLLLGWLYFPLGLLAIWIVLECCLVTKDGRGHELA